MYKLLLCWRYLVSRYLALACIISIMLGVATLIVVNSVMAGFSTKLKDRLHGLLSDVLVESLVHNGFDDPQEKMQRIWNSPIGNKIAAMTPTIDIPGLIQITYHGMPMPPRPVRLIGIDPKGRANLGGFKEYLTDPRNRENPSFELSPEVQRLHDEKYGIPITLPPMVEPIGPDGLPPPEPVPDEPKVLPNVFVGYAIANYRARHVSANDPNKDVTVLERGDEAILITVSGELIHGQMLRPVDDRVVVADFFKSEMSEYDAQNVFVPLDWLQRMRTMQNRATTLQIRLKDYREAPEVVQGLRELFPPPPESSYFVETWEGKQGTILAAIATERGLLNVLLFMIIGVAGFGILAIFAMIVAEKKRDIGILKALGASNGGILRIFIGYALLLGLVGAALGTLLGLVITIHLNDIEQFLGRLTGEEMFPRDVYYFDQIPTNIQPWMVALVNLGAVVIAVVFSVLPALRAALLHPVQALRYE
ncbi:MAG TPA: FtsX-like permease family protein [Gemmataceae bacterium]|nr:FtsX-like permease family protein [Gemmataceae bacterium]